GRGLQVRRYSIRAPPPVRKARARKIVGSTAAFRSFLEVGARGRPRTTRAARQVPPALSSMRGQSCPSPAARRARLTAPRYPEILAVTASLAQLRARLPALMLADPARRARRADRALTVRDAAAREQAFGELAAEVASAEQRSEGRRASASVITYP